MRKPNLPNNRGVNSTYPLSSTPGIAIHKKSAPCPERLCDYFSKKHCNCISAKYITRLAGGGKNQPLGLSLPFRCRRYSDSRLIAAVTNCPVLSPGSFVASIALATSCGTRAAMVCDFEFTALVAISAYSLVGVQQDITRNRGVQHLTCSTPCFKLVLNTCVRGEKTAKPVGATNTNGPLTITLSEVTSWLLYMIPNQELLLHRYPLVSRVGTIMTNLPHDYYVSLLKILLKKSTPAEKYSIALMLEREAMHIAGVNHSVFDAKAALVAKVTTGGRHACN